MISSSFSSKRRGATLAGLFSTAALSVVLLCGAGTVPIENFSPQGAMQSDLNAGGHSITNAATVSTTTLVVNGTNFTAAAVGSPGPAGTNGANGATGATGPQGVAGTNGINGTNGLAGATGPAGANGTNGATYTLPVATTSTLGGVKQGTNITIGSDGTISSTASGGGSYTLPAATTSVLGGVKIGSNVAVAGDGTISVGAPYTLPPATSSALGGVKQGTNITIGSDGTISSTASGSSSAAVTGFRYSSGSGTGNTDTAATTAQALALIGNLPVSNLNAGSSASSSTFWRGDGTWATPSSASTFPITGFLYSPGSGGTVAAATSAQVDSLIGTLSAANGGTGITSLGSNVATALGQPTGAPYTGLIVNPMNGIGDMMYANSSGVPTKLSGPYAGLGFLSEAGTGTSAVAPTWAPINSSIATALNVNPNGSLGLLQLTSGSMVSTAKLGTGTASSTTYLRGDSTWATPSGSAAMTGFRYSSSNGTGATDAAATTAQAIALIGSLPVTSFNLGSGASATTFWRGDGTWATPSGSGGSSSAAVTGIRYSASGGTGSTDTAATPAQMAAALTGGAGTLNLSGYTLSLAASQIPTLNQSTTGNATTATTAGAVPLAGITGAGSNVLADAANAVDASGGLASSSALTTATGASALETTLGSYYLTPAVAAAAYSPIAGSSSIVTVGTLTSGSIPYSMITGSPSALPPNGSAGGDLAGSYPSPTVTNGSHLGSGTVPNAALVTTPLIPNAIGTTVQSYSANTTTLGNTFGTGAGTFAQGNDSRFPASVTGIRKSAGAGSTDVAAAQGDITALLSGVYPLVSNNLSEFATNLTASQNLGVQMASIIPESANFTITAAQRGAVFNVTTGASNIVVTLPAASTGFNCVIRKLDSSTGTVTVNGATFGSMGHRIAVFSDGASFYNLGAGGGFDATGNWVFTNPLNANYNVITSGTGQLQSNGLPVMALDANGNAPYDFHSMNGDSGSLLVEGDSISAGLDASTPFGTLLAQSPFFKNHFTYRNDSVSGATVQSGNQGTLTLATATGTLSTTSTSVPLSGPVNVSGVPGPYELVTGTGIPAATYVLSYSGSTAVLSNTPTSSGSTALTFYPGNMLDRYPIFIHPHRPFANATSTAGTGTITIDGSGNVTGTGTSFTTQLAVAGTIYAGGKLYTVSSIASATSAVATSSSSPLTLASASSFTTGGDGGAKVIMLLLGGVNDLTLGRLAGQLQTDLTTECGLAVADGIQIYDSTILPTQTTTWTSGMEAARLAVNGAIRGNVVYCTGPLHYDDILPDPSNTAYFNGDKLHPLQSGQVAIASYLIGFFNAGGNFNTPTPGVTSLPQSMPSLTVTGKYKTAVGYPVSITDTYPGSIEGGVQLLAPSLSAGGTFALVNAVPVGGLANDDFNILETYVGANNTGNYVTMGLANPLKITSAGAITVPTSLTATAGSLIADGVGYGLQIKEGTNAKQGTATLVNGTVTVSDTAVTANSRIQITGGALNSSTAVGMLDIPTQTAGASFVITSYIPGGVTTQTGDLRTVSYEIFEPAP